MTFAWTPEAEDTLRRLYAEGCTTSEIALRIGAHSRGVVCGKIHRLKLAPPPVGSSQAERVRATATKAAEVRWSKAAEVKPQDRRSVSATASNVARHAAAGTGPFAQPIPLPELRRPVAKQAPRLLVDLAPRMCRYPVSDPPPGYGEQTLFCAAPTEEGKSYCPGCRKVALQAAPPRQSVRDLVRSARRFA